MPIQSTVFKGCQLGVEVTPGTAVAAPNRINSIGMSRIQPRSEGGLAFRAQGNKIASAIVPTGKQWSELDYQGVLDYQSFPYIGNSALITATASAWGTNGKKWTYAPTLSSADTRTTYTVEIGNSTRCQEAAFAQFNGLQLSFSKGENTISGSVLAGKRTDDVTVTTVTNDVTPRIVAPQNFRVYNASTKAALGTAQVETATAAGSITGTGNATITVTAAGMGGSPKAVSVAVVNGDSAATWAGLTRTALAADSDVTAFFIVGGSGTAITLTAKTIAANDATMNIATANGTCTGITAAPTSANTTAGTVAPSEWGLVTKAMFTLPPTVAPLFRMHSSDTTYFGLVPQALDGIQLELTVGDDDADFGTLLAAIDSGASTWWRIAATGNAISGANATADYFQLDFSGALLVPETPEEEAGAALNKFTYTGVYDTTSALQHEIVVVNTLASVA